MTVQATAVWRVRPSGNNLNGGGYDSASYPGGTDYSQQNAAQASGTNGAGSATTTFTDATANAFTAAMVGNAIQIVGQGTYFVVTFTSASQVVVDRALGTFSAASWKLGGGHADPLTNYSNAITSCVAVGGNIVYILGSGTPNPSAYTFDYTMPGPALGGSAGPGSATAGNILFANDPSTPGYKVPPDTTGGMPVIKTGNNFANGNYIAWAGLWFVGTGAAGGTLMGAGNSGVSNTEVLGCVYDQNGNDIVCVGGNVVVSIIGCEMFSSVSAAVGTNYAHLGGGASVLIGCNIHDCIGGGINITNSNGNTINNTIIAKCGAIGIRNAVGWWINIQNCTIDGNGGNGIEITTQATMAWSNIINCIISNHTTAAKSGLVIDAGTAAQNSKLGALIDYNSYYNNTSNYTAINAAAHDTALGVTPYVAQSTENYTLA